MQHFKKTNIVENCFVYIKYYNEVAQFENEFSLQVLLS